TRNWAASAAGTAARTDFVNCETRGSALWVILNRPELHNAFNESMVSQLHHIFSSVIPNYPHGSLRSVVLTGTGRSFSAGADLNWMRKMVHYTKEENERDSRQLFDMFHSIRSCPLPVLGRINGPAVGGGSGLAAACDVAYTVS